jgi:2-methylisocitrate lyase-like PEP mutase family enzyme
VTSQGRRLKDLLERKGVTIAPGAVDVLSARVFKQVGYEMVWAGGFMSSASQLGWADANVISLTEHATYVRNIVLATDLPVLADVDNGYGSAINVIRTVREMESAGAAGIVIEDQIMPKRCGLFPGNRPIVSADEMAGKIRAATESRSDPDFVIVARTDAFGAGLGLEDALERATRYVDAGANAVLPISKAFENLAAFANAADLGAPLLTAPTLFPWVSTDDLDRLGFKIMIQPLVAALTMYRALHDAMSVLLEQGAPEVLVDRMWTFEDMTALVELDDITTWEERYMPSGSTLVETT